MHHNSILYKEPILPKLHLVGSLYNIFDTDVVRMGRRGVEIAELWTVVVELAVLSFQNSILSCLMFCFLLYW